MVKKILNLWKSCANPSVKLRVKFEQKMCTFVPSVQTSVQNPSFPPTFPAFPTTFPQSLHPYTSTILSTIPQPLLLQLQNI